MMRYTKEQLAEAAKRTSAFMKSAKGVDMIDSVQNKFAFGALDVKKQAIYTVTGVFKKEKTNRFGEEYTEVEFYSVSKESTFFQPDFVLQSTLAFSFDINDAEPMSLMDHLKDGVANPQFICKRFIPLMDGEIPAFFMSTYDPEKIALHFGVPAAGVRKLLRTKGSKRTEDEADLALEYRDWVRTQPPTKVLKPKYVKLYKKDWASMHDDLYGRLVGRTLLMELV